ncbi:QacE family quaternary ammonium compound efflux SMR transporter [Paracoccus sp. R12_1]|jgi:small multidrug resistance pump|uniref:SMR family transporter n=1 Tax=unclassified Paracoccus (in: a-proteobacteria) TaxID=2688777 RepID=UPI000C097CFA|nr:MULTISPECIES: SMR family transporter [unclassified Paracoccus (in: a-proteobacteria)]MBO9455492.1 QacE family quaternary ammonium compound efflux SMR transporter [Paracoccus sp. R12_2]MBO9485971.1 QacE family quaternary ammonium compound efflux SMR transporter [Paracoccus sp. R12_1]PHQ69755.1 MAG: QacE family quaternary ammonium compound efflux SMR transporter [Paracoccus sp. (in: a-proteobacteria)]
MIASPYLALVLAIGLEVVGTSFLQRSAQFTRLWPTVGMALCYLASFYLLSLSLRVLPLGVAYAIWSALGIVLVAVIGLLVFGQRLDLPAVIGLGLIVAGVIVVNLFSNTIGH